MNEIECTMKLTDEERDDIKRLLSMSQKEIEDYVDSGMECGAEFIALWKALSRLAWKQV